MNSAAASFVLLGTIVEAFVPKLFPGIERARLLPVPRHPQQRPVRRRGGGRRPGRALRGRTRHRRYGDAVRLEVARDCPEDIGQFLLRAVRA